MLTAGRGLHALDGEHGVELELNLSVTSVASPPVLREPGQARF